MSNKLVYKKHILTRGISIISITLILIVWTVSTNLKWVDPVFLPTPQSVWKAFLELIRDGYKGASLSTHILNSLYRLFLALILAVFTAVPLGIFCGISKYILAIFIRLLNFTDHFLH